MTATSMKLYVTLGLALLTASCDKHGEECPSILREATRLILVTTSSMDGPLAQLSTYERASAAEPWRRVSVPEPAVIGDNGVAWGWTFRNRAKWGEPLKTEGDKRTPAGVFALGPTFGFSASSAPAHMKLEKDQHICVDDPASPHYNRIVSRDVAGLGTHGEEMESVVVYEKGIAVDYPTDREARAGSCIFVHIWQGEGRGTSGCVAAPGATIARLQDFARSGPSVIAIMPELARERFRGCLP